MGTRSGLTQQDETVLNKHLQIFDHHTYETRTHALFMRIVKFSFN